MTKTFILKGLSGDVRHEVSKLTEAELPFEVCEAVQKLLGLYGPGTELALSGTYYTNNEGCGLSVQLAVVASPVAKPAEPAAPEAPSESPVADVASTSEAPEPSNSECPEATTEVGPETPAGESGEAGSGS